VYRWKSLQRWSYAAVVLTAAHAFAYQEIEKRISPFKAVLCIVLGIVPGLPGSGCLEKQAKHG
jgi:DMSO/TMAO reductase YedYZ heme-binding membrane subunit